MKSCTKCATEKPLDEFARNAMGRFGRHSVCKDCMNAARRAKHDPQKSAEAHARYYEANRETVLRRTAAWAALNREKVAGYSRAWREKNSEKQREACKAWRLANPGKQAEHYRANDFKRRAAGYTKTAAVRDAIAACKESYQVGGRYLDAYTMELIDSPTVDHVVPLAHGGANTAENMVLTSRSNNSSKRDRSLVMFLLSRRAA